MPEEDSLTHLESLIAEVRMYRYELYVEYQNLMQEEPPNMVRLDVVAERRIIASKALNELSLRMLECVESQQYPNQKPFNLATDSVG